MDDGAARQDVTWASECDVGLVDVVMVVMVVMVVRAGLSNAAAPDRREGVNTADPRISGAPS